MEDLDLLLWHLPNIPDDINGNTKVGIIDSCIDTEHESLQGKIIGQEYIKECQQKIKHVNVDNQYDIHGTCMSGIIGAREMTLECGNDYYKDKYPHLKVKGIAREAYFTAIADYPNLKDVKTIIDSYNKETKSGVKYFPKMERAELTIINLSGGERGATVAQDWNDYLVNLCKKNIDNHIIVSAAGNDGLDLGANPNAKVFPSANKNPKICGKLNMQHVVSVACLAKNNTNLCSKSNYGSDYVDIAAPGELIPCPIPNNLADMPGQGTSQATAVTTGAIALLKGCDPYANATEIMNHLFSNADKLQSLENKVKEGKVLNIEKATKSFCFKKESSKKILKDDKDTTNNLWSWYYFLIPISFLLVVGGCYKVNKQQHLKTE